MKECQNREPYFSLLVDECDSLFLKLRLVFSRTEKYTAGSFLKELNSLKKISQGTLEEYYSLLLKDNKAVIVKGCELKSDYIRRNNEIICDTKGINNIYNIKPTIIVVSLKHAQEFDKQFRKFYNSVYSKKNNYPEYISSYQRERFHQDNHSDDAKYKTIINFVDGIKYITRRVKPGIDLNFILRQLDEVGSIIMSFENLCTYTSEKFISKGIFGMQSYDVLIKNRAKMFYCSSNPQVQKFKKIWRIITQIL